jgi:transcriptional regulator with XRE-family HTH domain
MRETACAFLLTGLSSLLEIVSTMREAPKADSYRDINSRIALRVRALRAELGMSLEALAAKCDVSRSMLSLIERGESSPTAVVLEKISAGLAVPLASLFDDTAQPVSPLSRRADRTTWRDPQSGYVRRNISPSNFPTPIQIVEVTMPAGARVAYESGPRDADIHQQVWVKEGGIDVSIGSVTYSLVADDCLAMQLNEPIAFHNRTHKPARYLVVLATERARALRK